MSNIALATEAHKHHFKICWKLADGRLVIHPVCLCSGCDTKAVVARDGWHGMRVVFIGNGKTESHAVELMEVS